MKKILYNSTNGKISGIAFRQAILKGLADDGGLFMPDSIPSISVDELSAFMSLEYPEIAAAIISKYTSDELGADHLLKLCTEAYNFDIPLEKVTDRRYILRLDQGPTASFKDFAARLMSRIMEHFLALENRKLTILTATSGDTGSAVANAFYGLQNINVIILFPIGEVSLMQRKQMTTLGKNITVVAVDGKFDDCQHLVKKAFLDDTLREIPLSSANSINIGRMLPQIVYYIYAWSRLAREVSDRIIFSVPSGNFGNLSAGLFAKKMGLPVEKFIVATNSNDEVPVFLKTREYTPLVPSKNCISSAMNVGHPSNLSRLIALYDGIMDEKGKILKQPSHGKLLNDLYGVSVSDDETRETIARVWQQHNVLLEPHGAVAWKGVTDYSRNVSDEGTFISLETAHPAKFPEELKKILNFMPELPPSLREVESGEEKFETITSNYSDLKKLILHRH